MACPRGAANSFSASNLSWGMPWFRREHRVWGVLQEGHDKGLKDRKPLAQSRKDGGQLQALEVLYLNFSAQP